jgi:hypothetical protein
MTRFASPPFPGRAPFSRRAAIQSLVGGSMIYPALLADLMAGEDADPLAPRRPHHRASAKNVIFVFSSGGVSHVDSFDPKPELARLAAEGTKLPRGDARPSPWAFSPGGRCGTEVSDLFPEIRECMDDICLVRSLHTDHNDHSQSTLQVHTGSFTVPRPSIGSWVSYGLGSENANLPSFVALASQPTYNGATVWNSNFLPPIHSALHIRPRQEVANIRPAAPPAVQSAELDLLRRLEAAAPADPNPMVAARARSFETAAGMQLAVPELYELESESAATRALYGLDEDVTSEFAWQCLMARRLVERGVRFVEIVDRGSGGNWDQHGNIERHEPLARAIDRPVAGLLRDLKIRGMLEDTLVVWISEFGRTPWATGTGRGHHSAAFSAWLAGGGVKGGTVWGATDEIGATVADDPVHIHDFHASILHALGFDHERLVYRHNGRDFRLTDVFGRARADWFA